MCLAIPGKIEALEAHNMASVDILGIKRSISIDLTPQAQVNDYVLVHAGFAIEIINAQEAQETINLIQEFPSLIENDLADAAKTTAVSDAGRATSASAVSDAGRTTSASAAANAERATVATANKHINSSEH